MSNSSTIFFNLSLCLTKDGALPKTLIDSRLDPAPPSIRSLLKFSKYWTACCISWSTVCFNSFSLPWLIALIKVSSPIVIVLVEAEKNADASFISLVRLILTS